MVHEFRLRTNAFSQLLEQSGLDLHQVVTMASMIEREAVSIEEMPLISSVFHNRLRAGMPLQSDPTAIYGIRVFGGRLPARMYSVTHRTTPTGSRACHPDLSAIRVLRPCVLLCIRQPPIIFTLWPAKMARTSFLGLLRNITRECGGFYGRGKSSARVSHER